MNGLFFCVHQKENNSTWVWDNMRVNEHCQELLFWVNYAFKTNTQVWPNAVGPPDFILPWKLWKKYFLSGCRNSNNKVVSTS